ncbi:hypothetical protein QQP08_005105 [Theobroma cacao]|nr:hypothetical protein QQP08_005105 [Theobroma cacao]
MKMLRLVSSLHPQIPSTSPKLSFTYKDASLFPKPQVQVPKYPSRFALFAQNGNKDDLTKEPNKKQEGEENPKGQPNGSINGGDSRNERRSMFNFRLGDLLDPDPDNIVALGLTGIIYCILRPIQEQNWIAMPGDIKTGTKKGL